MPIDPMELYEELAGLVNTQQGGHVRPHRNFVQWLYQISISLYENKFENWGKSQKIIDDMSRPFLKSVSIKVESKGANYGLAALPLDYGHYSAARYYVTKEGAVPAVGIPTLDACGKEVPAAEFPAIKDPKLWEAMLSQMTAEQKEEAESDPKKIIEVPVKLVTNDRWGSALNHRFNGPTPAQPIITQSEGGFWVAPKDVSVIVLDYLRLPIQPTISYTVVPGNELTGEGDYIQYQKEKSTPLEWSILLRNEFLTRLEKKYGKYIRENFIYQASESDRQNGAE